MGLSAPKKRAKLSHDPNNTAWARNTESFGHKILSSQGWAPGQTLGAEGAAHADHYTAASNSHIRVLLKDDQLGLGASRGGNNAETFGLSLFSGILGRLNGKSDVQLEKEQSAQRDVELALYQSRKKGYINFVSAGFLVGDRIDKAELMKKEDLEKAKKEKTLPAATAVEGTSQTKATDPEAQGTKRKRAGAEPAESQPSSDSDSSSSSEEEEDDDEVEEPAPKSKKSRSSNKESSSETDGLSKKVKKSKSKKDKKRKTSGSSGSEDADDERAAKKARKAERRAAKEQRRADKEERRKKKEARRAAKSGSNTPASGSATPQAAAAAPFIGRHAVRQRYIAAKGRAHLDPQALKEIFMVKA